MRFETKKTSTNSDTVGYRSCEGLSKFSRT